MIPLYRELAAEHLAKNPVCQINSPVHDPLAPVHVHHKKGRVGKMLIDSKHFLTACDPCNGFCSDHPDWAMQNGHIASRLAVEEIL
jgi:hypothetical protein